MWKGVNKSLHMGTERTGGSYDDSILEIQYFLSCPTTWKTRADEAKQPQPIKRYAALKSWEEAVLKRLLLTKWIKSCKNRLDPSLPRFSFLSIFNPSFLWGVFFESEWELDYSKPMKLRFGGFLQMATELGWSRLSLCTWLPAQCAVLFCFSQISTLGHRKHTGWAPLTSESKMCPQPISHNQRGQENVESVNPLWFCSGKGLTFSHVRGKQWETNGEFRENAVCMQEKSIGHRN